MFRDAFKEMLIFEPPTSLKANTEYPSPTQLMGKIIIKHKKLEKGHSDVAIDAQKNDEDVSSAIHNGFLLIEDPFDHKWQKVSLDFRHCCIFVLLDVVHSTTSC